MNRLRKALTFAAFTLVAAASLLVFKPIRAWASQEGSYLYHQFFLNGPAVFYGAGTAYTGSDNTARLGVAITTGTPTAMTGVASMRFRGAQAAKPASSNEGDIYYDTAQHSIAIATCTSAGNDCWVKALINTANGGWSLY